MAYLKDFRERIQNNDYPGFLKIWEEYCYGDQPDGEEMIAILEEMKNSDLAKPFGLQVERAIPIWRELKNPESAHLVLSLILDLQTTNSETLADLATEHIKAKYTNDPLLNEKLRLVGLRNRERFQGAIRNFELLTHFEKGNFVFHTAGWGTGEVMNVSLVREEVTFEFEEVVGLQPLSFEKAFKTLIVLKKDHFYSRRFGNPDLLEKEAKENPMQLMHTLLQDLGPKTTAEIKEELIDLVIPAEEWNRWWQGARAKMKKDTKIECPPDLKKPFRLRKKELPHEQVLHKSLEANPSVHSFIQIIYTFLRDFSETLKNKEFKTSLEEKLLNMIQTKTLSDAQKLQIHFLLEEIGSKAIEGEIEAFLKRSQNDLQVIRDIDITAFQKKTLQKLVKYKDNAIETLLEVLFTTDQASIRDYILTEMKTKETEKMLHQKLISLLMHPISFPEVFVWYFQKLWGKASSLPFSDSEGKNRFFEGLLILLSNIEQKPQFKDLTKKILGLISDKRYIIVREVMKNSKIEEAKEFVLLATKCQSFEDHDIRIFQSLAEVVHPSLSSLRKDKPSEAENIIWTTQEGYTKVQLRMQQIATVETVNNAKEIEVARAHGDLRENAEFKAALERRARLQGELKLLSDQVNIARIITREDVLLDEVGIGAVVHCQDAKGEKLIFTLLGPWDADPEKRIISFQSKLAQAMKGKTIGERFTFQNEEFTIQDIDNFFDQK